MSLTSSLENHFLSFYLIIQLNAFKEQEQKSYDDLRPVPTFVRSYFQRTCYVFNQV